MMMKRNCNLELQLVTPSVSFHNNSSADEKVEQQQKQKLTIFYNGNVAASNVTELQAKVLISLARLEMEDRAAIGSPGSDPRSPLLQSPHSPTDLCMKRSLQRFLEKRKTRVHATPYHR